MRGPTGEECSEPMGDDDDGQRPPQRRLWMRETRAIIRSLLRRLLPFVW